MISRLMEYFSTDSLSVHAGSLRHAVRGTTAARLRRAAVLVALVACTTSASAADVINGAQIYARHCSACHGPAGVSVMPGAPNLARGERLMQSDMALLAAFKAGKNAMPAYIGILSDREILDVIAFSRTLRR